MTWLDLIDECDNFPHYHDDPELYERMLKDHLWRFLLGQNPGEVVGFVLNDVVNKMPWTDLWCLDPTNRTISIKDEDYNEAIRVQLDLARSDGTFELLKGWRDEQYAIANSLGLDVRMERSGTPLFGIITFGAHMTAYTRGNEGMKIWVARRSPTKQTYPSMLDNTVGGGMAAGEDPYECIVREAGEEASLPPQLVKENIVACGTVTYWHERDERAGGEIGMMQPECQFIYDLELPGEVIPKPADDEVAGFELLSVEDVNKALENREFKPNCALVMIDFLIRHGQVPASEQKDLFDIVPRLHRQLRFDRRAGSRARPDLSFSSGREQASIPQCAR